MSADAAAVYAYTKGTPADFRAAEGLSTRKSAGMMLGGMVKRDVVDCMPSSADVARLPQQQETRACKAVPPFMYTMVDQHRALTCVIQARAVVQGQ